MTPSTRLPSLRFDTAPLPRAQQFDAWREAVGVTHEISAPGRATRDGLVASSDVWCLGQTVVSFRRFPALRFARADRRARSDGLDHYSLLLMREGEWRGEVDGSEVVVGPGEVCLFDLARPVENLVTDNASLRVMLPRERVDALLPPGALPPHGAKLGDAAGMILAGYLAHLHNTIDGLAADQAPALERATLELVAACLAPSRDRAAAASADIAATVLRRARAHIEAHLAEPGLDPAAIGRALGLSRSALYRLFTPFGGIAGYIQARRLARVRALLADPRERRRISELAFSHGFTDEAHFSRSFRRTFGLSPSDVRAGGHEAMRAMRGGPLYQAWVRGVAA